MRCVTAILIASLVFPATAVCAQANSPLEIGDLLRITAPECGLDAQLARYLRLYRDTLTVQADSELVFPVASLTRLDVSRGLSNKPTLLGIVAGAFAGVLVGIAIAADEGTEITGGSRTGTSVMQVVQPTGGGGSTTVSGALVGPIAGALIGGFVGGVFGKAFRKHRWEAVPLDDIRVSFAPQEGGTLSVCLSARIGYNGTSLLQVSTPR